MPINSRAKGARGERLFCAFLRGKGYRARRAQQYAGVPSEDSADVITALDALLYIDVKNTERLFPLEWMAKALSDRGPGGTRIPTIAWKKNRGDWVAMLSMSDLIHLIRHQLPAPHSEPLGTDEEATDAPNPDG